MDPSENNPVTDATGAEVAAEFDQLVPAPEETPDQPSPEGEGTADEVRLDLPFKLEEITDDRTLTGAEARTFLTTRQAQMQAALTRKTTELAEQRKQAEKWLSVEQRLADESTRQEAIQELLSEYDIDLEFDDDDEYADQHLLDEPTDPTERTLSELRERQDRLEQAELTRRQQQTEQERAAAYDAHVAQGLETYAEQAGFEQLSDIPPQFVQDIMARAAVIPALPDGLPNLDQAVADHLAYREYLAQQERASYLRSKQAPNVEVSGAAGEAVLDLSTKDARLKHAAAVAGRHY